MLIVFIIIGLSLIILVHEAGHFFVAKAFGVRVDEFGLGFPPRLYSRRYGETEYSINALPFGGFVRIHGEQGRKEGLEEYDRSFIAQPAWKRALMLVSGVFMNMILGWILLTSVFMVGSPKHLLVSDVQPNSPAAAAGAFSGDIVMSVQFGERLLRDPIASDAFIELAHEAQGKEMALTLERHGERKDIMLIARENPPAGEGPLGVVLEDIGFDAQPILQSIGSGFRATIETLWAVAVGLGHFISRLFVEPSVIQTVSGPVGIVNLAFQAGLLGAAYVVQLMALISLNLAVLNLIPFPALDGGRVLLLLIEKLKGSPLPRKFEMIANATGFVVLIVLMVIVTIQDIGRL